MTCRFKLGLFDEDCEYNSIPYTACDCDEHAALALKASQESMVLLKNDGILPLDPEKVRSVAVIGPNANSIYCLEGNYNGTSSRYVTFLEGIRAYCAKHGIRVYYSEGCPLVADRVQELARPADRIAESVAMAEMCDVTILCLGLNATLEGEQNDCGNEFAGSDKENLELPSVQRQLVAAIEKTGRPFVSVVATGSAMRIEEGNAIIHAWYAGQAGGTALADILFGAVSPCGRLPVTFYKSCDDLPDFEDYSMENRTYRYFSGEALYPFGFGLSYADFRYSDARIENDQIVVDVENTGAVPAKEIVQVYVKKTDSPWDVRNCSLCGFTHVYLVPGEKCTVRLPLPQAAFEAIDSEGKKVSAGKHYRFFIGGSQPDAVSVRLTGKAPLEVEYHI